MRQLIWMDGQSVDWAVLGDRYLLMGTWLVPGDSYLLVGTWPVHSDDGMEGSIVRHTAPPYPHGEVVLDAGVIVR